MNKLLEKLLNASNSLRFVMGLSYVLLSLFKDKLGLTDESMQQILLIIAGLIGADTWRPLGGTITKDTATESS